jgi:GH18 family chitinase
MYNRRLFSAVLLIAFALGACAPGGTPAPATVVPGRRVVGYYAQWAAARGRFVSAIPAARITHINYAFSNVSADGRCVLGDQPADTGRVYTAAESVSGQADSSDTGALHGNFNQLLELKRKYPALQVLISVGGFSWSEHFSDAALNDASRRAFAASCIDLYLKQYQGVFDGIDIDWEYPGGGGLNPGRPEDKTNFTLLLAELRRELDELGKPAGKHYLLTIAAPAGPETSKNIERARIIRSVDWMNLMTYDLHGTWENSTNFNAPLYQAADDPSDASLNVDAVVQSYLAAGVPPNQLVLGVPFYGRGWKGVPASANGLYQTAGGAAPGKFEDGAFDYPELKELYLPTYKHYWDPAANVPWLYNPQTGIFISYDDPQSLAAKAGYAADQHLGGIMIWELSQGAPELLDAIQKGFTTGGPARPTAPPQVMSPRPFEARLHAVSGIKVDADLSDWPAAPNFSLTDRSQVVYSLTPKSWAGPQDLSALAWAGWAPDGLYFAFQVTDDRHFQTQAGTDLWHGDYMELQFDTLLEKDYNAKTMDDDDYQIGVSVGDFGKVPPVAFAWFNGAQSAGALKIRQAQKKTANGYILELFIPKELLPGLSLTENATLGMNISPSDADSQADGQKVMMSTSSTRTYADPRTFGKITLVK